MMTLNLRATKIRFPPWLLLVAAAALAFIHLGTNLKWGNYSHFAISLVYWFAVGSIVRDKHRQIKYQSDLYSCGLGILTFGFTFALGAVISPNLFLGFAPLFMALGLMLLASGMKHLSQYYSELIILFSLGVPKIALKFIPDIAPITAKFSAFWLYYCGFDVLLQENTIILPQGAVDVVPSCSGLNLILYMLGLSVIFLSIFPVSQTKIMKFLVVIMAAMVGFFVNSLRVAILALLSGDLSRLTFEYWHSQEGALIFVMLSVVIYSVFCWLILGYSSPKY
ncbi:MAG: cyanoexosortase A [Cyanobacteria bacterium P01_A01_bin.40]